jgi:N-formylglutamate amidohydrolase
VIYHVPHDSTVIPPDLARQFVLGEAELEMELLRMTDHHSRALLVSSDVPPAQVIRAPVSRLVVDVERFEADAEEAMSRLGMGAVYLNTAFGAALRRPLMAAERERLLASYYRPHHRRLTAAVDRALASHGRALVLDAHSFPSAPLPYEPDQDPDRPGICLGTDPFHTPYPLQEAMLAAFCAAGQEVCINRPFAGALVPAGRYRRDPRVAALMIEVNRGIYLDEATGTRQPGFAAIAAGIQQSLKRGLWAWLLG